MLEKAEKDEDVICSRKANGTHFLCKLYQISVQSTAVQKV
jgi:hypothetical protein